MSKVTTVGDRVKLKKDNLLGVVRFVGEIQSKKGIFFGIELDDAKGKNNGTVGKVAYFKCKKKKGIFIKDTQIAKTNAKTNDAPRVTVGDTVKCKKQKCNGKIRFIGTPYSVKKDGTFYGVQLDKPNGKNNGTVKGRWYFTTKKNHAAFVTAKGMSLVSEEKKDAEPEPEPKKKAKKKKKAKAPPSPRRSKKLILEEKKEDVVYVVGDKVELEPKKNPKRGQIKWIGEWKDWPTGKYYGVRLTEKRGDTDGEWKDKRFFQCEPGFGVYVQLRMIIKTIEADFDFTDEESKFEEAARAQAEVYKKEADKLKRLREKFSEADTDGNQTIDQKEFRKLAGQIFNCSWSEANALFKDIDVNDSGSISFAEFDAWVDKIGGVDKLEEAEAEAKAADDDDKEEEEAAPNEEEAANEEENEAADDDNKAEEDEDENNDDDGDADAGGDGDGGD